MGTGNGFWRGVCVCPSPGHVQWEWRRHLTRTSLSMTGGPCVLAPSLCPPVEMHLHPGCWVSKAVMWPVRKVQGPGMGRAGLLGTRLLSAAPPTEAANHPSPLELHPPPQGSLRAQFGVFSGFLGDCIVTHARSLHLASQAPHPRAAWGSRIVSH